MSTTSLRRILPTQVDATVKPVELFFDLVFVFALTQVTAMMADDLTVSGLFRGLLVLTLLWWSWAGFAWLCNVVRSDSVPVTLVLFAAMAAMLVLALSIPEAFDDMPGGLPGPVVVAACYFAFRLMHLVMFWLISADNPMLRRQLVRFAPSMLAGTTLLLVAAGLDGTAQTAMWATALVADYVGTLLGGSSGWVLRSPSHFAERHGLILIVALGESIVAIGVGVAQLPISVSVVAGSILGLAVTCALWWAYFDISATHAEHALAQEPETTKARLARDAYSYLHLPLMAGVIMIALGMKKVLEYVGDTAHHDLADPLPAVAVLALFGGALLYLGGHVGFKWRTAHRLMPSRVAAAAVLVLAGLLAPSLPALAALGLLAVVLAAMVAFETLYYAEHREVAHPS